MQRYVLGHVVEAYMLAHVLYYHCMITGCSCVPFSLLLYAHVCHADVCEGSSGHLVNARLLTGIPQCHWQQGVPRGECHSLCIQRH